MRSTSDSAAALPAAAVTAASGIALAAAVLGDAATPTPPGEVVRALGGAAAYLTLLTLLSVAVGALVRRALAAVAALSAYLFIAGRVLREHVAAARYLPDTAGSALWFPADGGTGVVTPLQGALLMAAWTALLIATAVLGYRRGDA